jgi:hypothetical protein
MAMGAVQRLVFSRRLTALANATASRMYLSIEKLTI